MSSRVQAQLDEKNDGHMIELIQKHTLVVVLKLNVNFELVCIPV